MCKTVSHWRSILKGGIPASKSNQTVNKTTARIELFVFFNRIVSRFPVVQHQATTEAFDLVINTRVVKTSPGQTPL